MKDEIIPLSEQKGNMLPSTVTGLIEYARTRNVYNDTTSNGAERTTNFGNVIRKSVPGNEFSGSTVNSQGREKTSGDNGRIGTTEDSERGEYRTYQSTGYGTEQNAGSDTSTYEYNRGTNEGSRNVTPGTKFTEWVKNTPTKVKEFIDPFKKVLKEHTKEIKQKNKKSSGVRVLNDAEILKYKPRLIDFILWSSEHLDEFIQATTISHIPVEIWSDIDKEEAEVLADFMLARGKVHAGSANNVRNIIIFMDRLKVYTIVGPRTVKTAMTYWNEGIAIGPISVPLSRQSRKIQR